MSELVRLVQVKTKVIFPPVSDSYYVVWASENLKKGRPLVPLEASKSRAIVFGVFGGLWGGLDFETKMQIRDIPKFKVFDNFGS